MVAGFYQVSGNRMGKIRSFILIILTGLVLWQCAETREVDINELGINYFPLKTGTYHIYEVEGVRYNTMIDSTVFSYLLKESVVDSFQNLENGISYIIQRDKRLNDKEPWVLDSIWTARKDDRTAVMVENNIPIIKLSFPVGENINWDGNRLNSYDEKKFEMVDVGKPYSGSFDSFPKTITVIQEYIPANIVNSISKKEVYAENVGLISKENIILIYVQGTGIIDSGIKYYQHLVAYGEE